MQNTALVPDTFELLSESEFIGHVTRELALAGPVTLEDKLVADLGIDSLGMMALALVLLDLGVVLPNAALLQLETLADAYHYYCTKASSADGRAFVAGVADSSDGERRAPLTGHLVRLRPLTRADYDFFYNLVASDAIGFRWRHSGVTPSPDEFVARLWENVVVQFVAERTDTGEAVGLVQAVDPSPSGYAYIGVLTAPKYIGSGWTFEATALLVEHVFDHFDFRRLYAETAEASFDALSSGAGRFFEHLGALRDHEFSNGSYADVHVLMVTRDRWRSLETTDLRNYFRLLVHEENTSENGRSR